MSDVRRVAIPVLRHRISTNFQAQAEGLTTEDIVNRLLGEIPEPTVPKYGDATFRISELGFPGFEGVKMPRIAFRRLGHERCLQACIGFVTERTWEVRASVWIRGNGSFLGADDFHQPGVGCPWIAVPAGKPVFARATPYAEQSQRLCSTCGHS